ncbi:hypothetical protein HOY80DRAFT_1061615 [Tuber brumale]|nr:hypothetical protein HOY80DRAFT_1061615 [Tuber brumale]
MPSYIITVKPETSDEELLKIKNDIVDQGGKIVHEYSLIKGFSCELPKHHVSTLQTHARVESVEADGVVTTQ